VSRFLAMAVLFAAAACLAEEMPSSDDAAMSTDRPGYGESTDIVGRRVLQFEAGLTVDNTSEDGAHSHTLGVTGTVFRTGVASCMEFRSSTDGVQYQHDSAPDAASVSHAGLADFGIGAKFRLLQEHRHAPAVSMIAELTFPTGSGGFSDGGYNPEVEIIWAKSLGRGFSAGGNLNVWWSPGDTGGSPGHAQSLTFGHALPAGLQGFWEVYHVAPPPGPDAPSWNTDAGFSRMIGKNAQWDLEAGHSLMARVSDWFIGAGLSFRVFVGRN